VGLGLVTAGVVFAISAGTAPSSTSATGAAQADPSSTDSSQVGASDIPFLTLIDRLQLTRDQMQKVHDILSSVLDKVTALQDGEKAIAADLLAFNGTGDALAQKLSDVKTQIAQLETAVQQARAAAKKELGDLLTYNQGQLLQGLLAEKAAARATGTSGLTQGTGGKAGSNPNQGTTSIVPRSGAGRTQTSSVQGLLGNGNLGTQRQAVRNGLQGGKAQLLGQGQALSETLRIAQASQGAPVLERLVQLLELKLAQQPS